LEETSNRGSQSFTENACGREEDGIRKSYELIEKTLPAKQKRAFLAAQEKLASLGKN